VQGKTLDYFILCIGPRKGLKPAIKLTDLYVLASRVRHSKRLFVIGFDPAVENAHLRNLTPAPVLGIWRAGYDTSTGRWEPQLAIKYANDLAVRK